MDPDLSHRCAAYMMLFTSAAVGDLLRRVLAPAEMIMTGHEQLTPSDHAMQGLQ